MNRTITAVAGVTAGHWTHESGTTGVTVVLFPEGAVGAVAVPGSASGGRELGALEPRHIAGSVHGFCLSGGSAFGLAAADGVMAVLEERGIGFDTGVAPVPIVPAAILFDLPVAKARPDAASGRLAAEAASDAPLAEGAVGAGGGARVAKATGTPVPGGVGSWSEVHQGIRVGAVVAVNAVGSIYDRERGAFVAGSATTAAMNGVIGSVKHANGDVGVWRGQTTLAIVSTDAGLDRARADVVARMATAGMARAIYPAFTPFDGDTVFVAATGAGPTVEDPPTLSAIGDLAATCVERAIVRAVIAARSES